MNTSSLNSQDAFSPVFLLPPDTASLKQLRERVNDSTSKIELYLRLSNKPERLWSAKFGLLWGLFYPDIEPPMIGVNNLIITSTPAKLQSQIEIARVVVEWTNSIALPLLRGEAAQYEADMKRNRALEEFQNQPRKLPAVGLTSGDESAQIALYDAAMAMAKREYDALEKQLRKQLALEEIDAAIRTLTEAYAVIKKS